MIWSDICILIILFFVFACLGWVMEVSLKYIQYRRFINRGFLIGPYCPIYGWGVLAVTVLVGGIISRRGTIGETFLVGMVICGALEYFTSWYMEKLFHARWWDYSQKPMNLNGRIWIGNLLLFGLASVVIVWWIDPVFFSLLNRWPPFWLHVAAIAIIVLMLADHLASHFLMNIVRREIDAQDGDNTEEISRRIHQLLRDRNLLVRRINEAYPDLQARPHAMTRQFQQARKQYRAARKEFTRLLREAARAQKNALTGSSDVNWAQRLEDAAAAQRQARKAFHEMQRKYLTRHWSDPDDQV